MSQNDLGKCETAGCNELAIGFDNEGFRGCKRCLRICETAGCNELAVGFDREKSRACWECLEKYYRLQEDEEAENAGA